MALSIEEIEKAIPKYIDEHTLENPLVHLMESILMEDSHRYSIDYIDKKGTYTICDNMTKEEGEFIAVAIMTTKQYIAARKFEVTEEFIDKVAKRLGMIEDSTYHNPDGGLHINDRRAVAPFLQEVLKTMWQEVENA